MGDVVRKVKLMAVELDVPAVLLAQMNRDSDRRLASISADLERPA
ncbi:MAG: hypothetical protein ACLR6J_03930 [Parabacteroides merdae]